MGVGDPYIRRSQMKVVPGDVVFGSGGVPGVVQKRDSLTGKLTVENQGPEYQATRKYGFINGLPDQERIKFREIIDRVREMDDPAMRVAELSVQIDDLAKDPRNQRLVRYLESEKAHIMFSEAISPRSYTLDEAKLL